MEYQKKIQVSPCSKLVLDGGRITGMHGDTWQGIQVWGNSSESQVSIPGQACAQGKLILKERMLLLRMLK